MSAYPSTQITIEHPPPANSAKTNNPHHPLIKAKRAPHQVYITNWALVAVIITLVIVGVGLMPWGIVEQVDQNRCNSDKDETQHDIDKYQIKLDDAVEDWIYCTNVACPVPVCYSCCPPCTNYTGELSVFGNGSLILPGQQPTSTLDYTDFGNIAASNYTEYNFTLSNNASSTTLAVGGRNTNAGPGINFFYVTSSFGFSVQAINGTSYTNNQFSISGGSYAIVTIRFTAGAAPTITNAVVQIASSDPVVPLYTFYLKATTTP